MKNKLIIPTVTAHSGSMGLPDNSIEAMEAGIDAGASIVEFDLRFLEDSTPVLSHDAPAEEPVTLADAFALLQRRPGVQANVDVKDPFHLEVVAPLAKEMGVLDRLFYTGVGEDWVPVVRAKSPEISYYLNTDVLDDPDVDHAAPPAAVYAALAEKTKRLGAVGINIHYSHLDEALSAAFRAAGLPVSVWTVNKPREIARVLALRPANITSRRPDLVCARLKGTGTNDVVF